jgi:hypothetical protein
MQMAVILSIFSSFVRKYFQNLAPASKRRRMPLSILKRQFYLTSRVARFFSTQYTKTGKKQTKLPQNIPKVQKAYQMAVE